MKKWICIWAMIISLVAPGLIFCEQGQAIPETQTRQGTVTEVDSVNSRLVVYDGNEQVRFSVDEGAKIQCGDEDLMLDQIEQDDSVTVQYYKSLDGVLHAVSIVDNNVTTGF